MSPSPCFLLWPGSGGVMREGFQHRAGRTVNARQMFPFAYLMFSLSFSPVCPFSHFSATGASCLNRRANASKAFGVHPSLSSFKISSLSPYPPALLRPHEFWSLTDSALSHSSRGTLARDLTPPNVRGGPSSVWGRYWLSPSVASS